jgi:hypothetical protein
MLCLKQNVFFILNVSDLLLLDKDVLVDTLHGIHSPCFLINYEVHFSERALVDDSLNLEIIQ